MKSIINFSSAWDSISNIPLHIALLIILIFSGCEKILMQKDPSTEPEAVFREVWTVLDERYPFFELKEIDWNEMYDKYYPKVAVSSGDRQLFNTIGEMIIELKDGHTDLHSQYGNQYYWPVTDKYMQNFNINVIQQYYLNNHYKQYNAIIYGMIDETGYIFIENFSEDVNEETVDTIFREFQYTKNLIFDVRNNTGGNSANGNLFISHLIDSRLYHKMIYFKKDKDHNSFASGEFYISPHDKTPYEGNITVLINRASFSATNSFIGALSQLPQVTLIGDTTGGGGSTPYYYELQNGWILRYSSTKEARVSDGWLYEKGFPPDFYVKQDSDDFSDNVLDFALDHLNNN